MQLYGKDQLENDGQPEDWHGDSEHRCCCTQVVDEGVRSGGSQDSQGYPYSKRDQQSEDRQLKRLWKPFGKQWQNW